MKKSNIALTTLLAGSIFINAGMAKANTQSDRQEIIQRINSMIEGCNARNIQQCYAYCSENFQATQADGTTINLIEDIQGIQRSFQKASYYQLREEVIRVSVDGNSAGVIGLQYADSIIGNRRIHRQIPYEDVWKRTHNGWLLVYRRWYEGSSNEVAIGQSPTQAAPLPPSTSINEQFNFIWQMPRFWNP
ncbi:hypothetical protein VF14_19715 [Nostoc linckia z18]|uniref:DUF4440 domain-containing protein n=3 Tax=Nostoc linckia TaxID=92942 RepID=A0A9Q5ZDE7_NOSLI|nr:hypothetical protein VF02_14890 [Nostoc linckia z1]PHJ68514.1 hypothetical protein VF05_15580 [Nostoc linckia z3]PHJ74283.1 hypothetical protein VF03_14715 [Nostoc linckia z2]PHJ80346.1 hypothetical protein VF06_22950 [Nostoc linckia z4]PHJ87820.1 hypothetical protein VF07_18695 [Nostoc linckia z6]PHJ98099.1 hypothetical protein VF04_10625 [Nostoc linckia z7]PHK04416.1 hypothetical protein VF08_11420 [Nostoc linckia z8]PHK04954.1 hypothetical protein VF09_27575 [Nostoc linckia z9]PHK1624